MQTTNRLRLVLDVEYDLEDESIEGMQQHLEDQIRSGINGGMLSGDTSATVDSYSFSVTPVDGESHSLDLVIQMAESHVEDIESGIQEGLYDADENQDIGAKKAAIQSVSGLRDRIAACLDACEGVPTDMLQQMGTRAMERQRDRSYIDHSLFQETRAALVTVVAEIESHGAGANLDGARKLLKATEENAVGRPGGKLVRFVEQIADLDKWGDNGESEIDEPSDGAEDSHACLMDLIDQARLILKS